MASLLRLVLGVLLWFFLTPTTFAV